MNIRTAVPEDANRIKVLYKEVIQSGGGLARSEEEVTDEYVNHFIEEGLNDGLIIVVEHPDNPEQLIGEVHAYPSTVKTFKHVLSDFTIAVHPQFQGKKIGRTLFTIFLEEVGKNRTDIGKVELFVRESNSKAIQLYQSMGFLIEGRMEMRIKTKEGLFEADIAMGWQNPNFEFD
ncbi:MAG TPA: N-acetyltransferase [Cyclobacteriaceae bacterium]